MHSSSDTDLDAKQLKRRQIKKVEGFCHLLQRPSGLDLSLKALLMEALHLKKQKKASALYMSWLKCSLCRRYIIRIQMMTSLRNQALRVFVESKFYGIMTIAISQQYYQGM